MLFNSTEFLIFLFFSFFLYWKVFNRSRSLQNIFIVFISYLFYGWWDYRFLGLIFLSSVSDYIISSQLGSTDAENSIKRKFLLFTSLFINIGFLLYFKYFNFFIDSFVVLLESIGLSSNVSSLNIVLPVGISFYTFQTLSYTIDVYRKELTPTKDFFAFLAFVSFFPQLVAGPIERAKKLLPQFLEGRKFNRLDAEDGVKQMLWGFFKKVVIADNCATFVDIIFNNSADYGSGALLLGSVLFAFQIYGDFSGYSDIAIGLAKLFGFKLSKNFNFPYFSRDIAEFWRRWHISLSTWFRDYLYIPLGGSKVSKAKVIRNTFVIFIVSGFWHGANWTFIFWGLLHSLFFMPLLLTNKNRRHRGVVAENSLLPNLVELLRMVKTFILVCLAWIFFRASSIESAFNYLLNIVTLKKGVKSLQSSGIDMQTLFFSFLFIAFLLLIEWIQRKKDHGLESFLAKSKFRYFVYALLFILILVNFGSKQTFIYFQF